MSDPYLILHKVRGEPAFDIAERCEIDGEEAWILSTCGYRAYPFASWNVNKLLERTNITPLDMPPDLQDCFACNDRSLSPTFIIRSQRAATLLQELGLVKKVEIERRD